ncbi:MAG: hypothetical protein RL220_1870, partial [Bacteroidota bacterium]
MRERCTCCGRWIWGSPPWQGGDLGEDGRINNLPHLRDKRRALRNSASPAKVVLWKTLQQRKLQGRKFRRQHSIGEYILDFYCPAERIGIEIHGAEYFHSPPSPENMLRDEFFDWAGISVLRFEEKWVWLYKDELLNLIIREFRRHPPRPPA